MITHPERVAAAVTPRRAPDAAPCVHALAPTVLLTREVPMPLFLQVASKPATRAPLVATAVGGWAIAVSYTHLTLPTICSV